MSLPSENGSVDTFAATNWRHWTRRHPKYIGSFAVIEEHIAASDTNIADLHQLRELPLSNIGGATNVFEVKEGSTSVTLLNTVSSRSAESFSCLNDTSSNATFLTDPCNLQIGGPPASSAQWFGGGLSAPGMSNVTTQGYGSFAVVSPTNTSLTINQINPSLSIMNYGTYTLETVHPFMAKDYNAPTILPDIGSTDHKQLESAIINLFNIDPMPEFEDGINNAFSDDIEHIVRVFGNQGVRKLCDFFWKTPNLSCVGEALRRFGLIENETTLDKRLQTLVALLKHWSPVVRDAAIIGLAYLDDLRAIGAIEDAIRAEPVPVLRRDMEAIRDQLAHR
jgi:hypothetical protein